LGQKVPQHDVNRPKLGSGIFWNFKEFVGFVEILMPALIIYYANSRICYSILGIDNSRIAYAGIIPE
jgi:hypothetical protein